MHAPRPATEGRLVITPAGIEEVRRSPVDDQLASGEFDKRVLGQEAEERFLMLYEDLQQLVVVNVAGADEEKLGRALAEFERGFEVGVFADEHAIIPVRQAQKRHVKSAVLLREIQCVDDLMPALLKPTRESAWQLGINHELHAAKGRMRWTRESRAAKARQALMSSRSRSG